MVHAAQSKLRVTMVAKLVSTDELFVVGEKTRV